MSSCQVTRLGRGGRDMGNCGERAVAKWTWDEDGDRWLYVCGYHDNTIARDQEYGTRVEVSRE